MSIYNVPHNIPTMWSLVLKFQVCVQMIIMGIHIDDESRKEMVRGREKRGLKRGLEAERVGSIEHLT